MTSPGEPKPAFGKFYTTKAGEVDISATPKKILVFGLSGAGKTWAAAGGVSASGGKTMVALLETQGSDSVTRSNPEAVIPHTDKDDKRVKSPGEFREIREYFRSGEAKKDGYTTLVVDSITELQQMVKDAILKAKLLEYKAKINANIDAQLKSVPDAKKDEVRNQLEAKRDRDLSKPGIATLSQADWGTLGDMMRTVMRDLRDLPCNVIVTALADWKDDEESKRRIMSPLIEGGFKKSLNGFFHAVGYMYKRQDENVSEDEVARYILWEGDGSYLTKGCGALTGITKPDATLWLKVLANKATPEELESLVAKDAPRPSQRIGAAPAGGSSTEIPDWMKTA